MKNSSKKFKVYIIGLLLIGLGIFFILQEEITGMARTFSNSFGEYTTNTRLKDIQLESKTVVFENGDKEEFRLAKGFDVTVARENLGKARFMTLSPDKRIFVPDMIDYNLSPNGRILILEDFNEETKKFETQSTYLTGLRGPHNVAFYTDEDNKSWIYITLTEHLVRYPYTHGYTSPQVQSEIIYIFPNSQSLNADGSVWHITRTVIFENDSMYVSVGSGCNSCEENPDEDRAVVLKMNPNGTDVQKYASGIKKCGRHGNCIWNTVYNR